MSNKLSCIMPKCQTKYCKHQVKKIISKPAPYNNKPILLKSFNLFKEKPLIIPLLMMFSLIFSASICPIPTVLSIYIGKQIYLWGSKKITNQYYRAINFFQKRKKSNFKLIKKKKVFSKQMFKMKNKYIRKVYPVQIGGKNGEQILFECKIKDKGTLFELDSGASVSIISLDVLSYMDKSLQLEKLKEAPALHGVTGKRIKTYGVYDLEMEIQNIKFNIPITVIDRPGIFILGRDFMIHARASLIFNPVYNGFELRLNHRSHLSKIHLLEEKVLKPLESTSCTFKTRHVPFGEYYVSSSKLNNLQTQKRITIDKSNSNQCSLLIKNVTNKTLEVKKLDLHIFQILKESNLTDPMKIHLIEDTNDLSKHSKDVDSCIANDISQHSKDVESCIIRDSEILSNLEEDQRAGVDIGSLVYMPRKTRQEYIDSIDTKFDLVKEKIADFYMQSKVVACTEFDCGEMKDVPKLKLTIKPGKELPRQTKPYKLSYVDSLHVKSFIDYLCAFGLCRPARPDQQFGSPTFLIPRPDKSRSPRILIDMRKVNAVLEQNQASCVPDFYNSLKNILPHAKYCTSLDLKQCYYALPVDESVIESGINNILTPQGAYTLLRAITGCSSIPGYILAIFLEYLHKNEKGEYDFLTFLYIFFDDLNIFSLRHETLEDHLDKVIKVLKRLERLNLRIGDIKCKYAVDLDNDTIKVFGYTIGKGGIGIPDKKLAALENLACPKTQKELQSVLGALNFYRSILSLNIQGPMNVLYKYISPFRWDEQATLAFDQIIDRIKTQTHKIGQEKPNSVLILICDASVYAIGSVLLSLDVSEFLTTDDISTISVPTIKLFQDYENVKPISLHENLFMCLLYFLKKLSFQCEDVDNLIIRIYQQGGFNLHFAYFVEGTSENVYERFRDFLKKIPSPKDKEFVDFEKDPFIFSYTMLCVASLTQSQIIVITKHKDTYIKLCFGEYYNQLCILYENGIFYGLLCTDNNVFGKKTIPFFNKKDLHGEKMMMISILY